MSSSSSNAAPTYVEMSSSNGPATTSQVFLSHPTIETLGDVSGLTAYQIIERVRELTDAYLMHCTLVAYPSPKFQMPYHMTRLLSGLSPATDEQVGRIRSSLNYMTKNERYCWTSSLPHFSKYQHLLNIPTIHAFCAMTAHWCDHSMESRLLLQTHAELVSKGVDVDPNPPTPVLLNPDGVYALQRTSSIGPPGTDQYLYQGSYLMSVEKMFGYKFGVYDFETDTTVGEVPGFFRGVGSIVQPLLTASLDRLVTAYQAHPVQALANILFRLGIPRYGYVLSPATIQEEPSEEEQKIVEEWTLLFTSPLNPTQRVLRVVQEVMDAQAALKSDAEATLAMLYTSKADTHHNALGPNVVSLIASFVGTRLPDSAPELQIRSRPNCVGDEAMRLAGAML